MLKMQVHHLSVKKSYVVCAESKVHYGLFTNNFGQNLLTSFKSFEVIYSFLQGQKLLPSTHDKSRAVPSTKQIRIRAAHYSRYLP